MPKLLDLSTELLLAIVTHIPHTSLIPLALSSRRLNKLATPSIYEAVYFWGTGNYDFYDGIFIERIRFQKKLSEKKRPAASRIYNVTEFIRSIESATSLGSLVRSVDLVWYNRSVNDDADVRRLLQLVSCSPLKELRLLPPNLHFDFPRESPITCLGLRYEGYRPFEDGRNYLEVSRHSGDLCGISSLTYLSIAGWHNWAEHPWDALYPLVAKTSNVSHMFFWDNSTPGPEFQQIISLPKALRSLSFQAHHSFSDVLSSGDFHSALQTQIQSLEALRITGRDGTDIATDITQSVILSNLPSLKWLRIRVDFLVMPKQCYEDMRKLLGPGEALQTHRIANALPRSLEELQLEIYDSSEDGGHPTDDFEELMNWLEEIAANKASSFPFLKNVAFGEPFHSIPCQRNLQTYFRTDERSARVKAAYAGAEIRLHCWNLEDASPTDILWQPPNLWR